MKVKGSKYMFESYPKRHSTYLAHPCMPQTSERSVVHILQLGTSKECHGAYIECSRNATNQKGALKGLPRQEGNSATTWTKIT